MDGLRDRSMEDDEHKELARREAQQLRLRVTELETARTALERDLAAARNVFSGEEETTKQRMTALTQVRAIF